MTGSAPTHPPIERFKGGGRKTILLLGDPVQRGMHWNADLKCSVPCFLPAACPFCSDPKFTKTARPEGFAPVMVLNLRGRQWEQAVAVFTKGGLIQLAELKLRRRAESHRGWVMEVSKTAAPGATAPMKVAFRDEVPSDFPLPPEFDIKPVMMRVWFPQIDHAEPVQWIEPIKVERRRRSADSTPTLELGAEEAAMLAATLRARGLTNIAEAVEHEATGQGDQPESAEQDDTPTTPKLGALAVTELASDPKNYGPKTLARGAITPESEDESLSEGTGRTVCREVKEKRDTRRSAVQNSRAERRAAAAEERLTGQGTDRVELVGSTLDALEATFVVNGNGKKGGA